jgi:general stress protein 26
MSGTSARGELHDVLKAFATAMLVTRAPDGMHARPLAIARLDADGEIYFATSIDSPKVADIESEPAVLVTFQDGARHAVLRGSARILRDASLIDELWSEGWRIWFPAGKSDPLLAIIAVRPIDAEYWDDSGLARVHQLYAGAKAYLTGTRAETDDMHRHAKVDLAAVRR